MYYQIVQQCIQMLKNLDAWLDKAEEHAATKKFDINVLMSSRLAPDMQPFTFQVQSACDYVKGAAGRLCGNEPPKHEDTEKTIDEVRARIAETVWFAESIKGEQFAGADDRKVRVLFGPKDRPFLKSEDCVLQMTIPNVYFHVTMAYALLRHNGVDIGKMDFFGKLQ